MTGISTRSDQRREVSIGENIFPECERVDHIISDSTNLDSSGNTAYERSIFNSCRIGDFNRVKALLESNTPVNAKDTSGRRSTALHFAAGYGRLDIVELLLKNGLVPLHNACSFGHVDVVSALLSAGSDPNSRDAWNFTPLHEAAIKNKLDVCIQLLQARADPYIKNLDGKTSIDLTDGHTRLVLLGEWHKDELLEAARSGNEEKVLSLLTPQNVNCHANDGRKSTPLHLAAGYNRLFDSHLTSVVFFVISTKIVKLLLSRGADVQAKDKGGLIPLHNACSYGHLEVCELLISAGASQAQVRAADLWQYTPLHEAASKARAEVCSLLLVYGADPTLPNCHGKSPLDLAPSQELQERILYEYKGTLA
ncbi:unnamed protein product [Protopolystoma xenopodis]|uniref:Uncharacterized protein n=1 Tax=Protopolystoma xenopodis TaxID=117903 RepID=A0A448WRT8_9PLAT|nr:unnamed protein product [Protopolystoma xenopodis]